MIVEEHTNATHQPSKKSLVNLTLHKQNYLAEVLKNEWEVEIEPRLKPVENPTDYEQLKKVVKEAVKDLSIRTNVLIGGLGQYQALITQLPFRFWFVDMDFQTRTPKGIIEHQRWTRHELYEMGF